MDNLDTTGGMNAGLKGLIGVVLGAAIVVGALSLALFVVVNTV